MKFITIEEFNTLKVYELDDVTYRRIERAFSQTCGNAVAKRLMAKFMEKTVREISANSYVDILSLLTII